MPSLHSQQFLSIPKFRQLVPPPEDTIITKRPKDTLPSKKPLYNELQYQKWTTPSLMMKLPPSSESTFQCWSHAQILREFACFVGTSRDAYNASHATKSSNMDGKEW